MQPTPRWPRRSERKQRTREALLDAAVRVVARRGYERATLAEIAAEAGHTTGAVYASFDGKEDLLLAALEAEIARHIREVGEAVDAAGPPERRPAAAAEQWMGFLRSAPDRFPLFVEYWARAVRDPKLRRRFVRRFGALRDATAGLLEHAAKERDADLPMPAGELAVLLNALTNGIAMEKLADPAGVSDDLYARGLELMLSGLARSSSRG
jgi:AcrR family transcriptional regulator